MDTLIEFLIQSALSLSQNWSTAIFFVVVTWYSHKIYSKQVSGILEKLELVVASKEELQYLKENFDQVKEVKNMLESADSIFVVLDTLLMNVVGQLNANFSNGSSQERGLLDCDEFHSQFLEILNQRADITQTDKGHLIILVEVLHEELVKLTNQLALLTDYTVKPRIIVPYGKNLRAIINYFGLNSHGKYKTIPDKAVRTDLINKLRTYGSRMEHIRNPFSGA